MNTIHICLNRVHISVMNTLVQGLFRPECLHCELECLDLSRPKSTINLESSRFTYYVHIIRVSEIFVKMCKL